MAKFAIFAGHGGKDPGFVWDGRDGDVVPEKELTLAVSNFATALLRQAGHKVINNRTMDTNSSVSEKVALANSNNVDAVVEIHFNSNAGPFPRTGTEVYYAKSDGASKKLAQAILDQFVRLGLRDRGIKTRLTDRGRDYYEIIRETNAPAVLVECAFLNNPNDMELKNDRNFGRAIGNGIGAVFGYGTIKDLVILEGIQWINSRYMLGIVEDGVFDHDTQKGLCKALQVENNLQYMTDLVDDGLYGPLTKAAIRDVGLGAEGNIAKILQILLYANGHTSVKPDGIFGPVTLEAVKSYQKSKGLAVDGIAGPNTFEKLLTLP